MNKEGYKAIILDKLVPFFANNPRLKLIQDNDPKHNSNLCKEALREHQITWVNIN
jgi:hypothetical protein